MNTPNFNVKYKLNKQYWGLHPNKMVLKISKYAKKGTVLDLSAGQGLNAIYLAKKKYEVTAIDISNVGIKDLIKAAKKIKCKNKYCYL